MISYTAYEEAIKNEPNDKEFKKFNKRCFIYRGILIDYNFDVPDAETDEAQALRHPSDDEFDPYYDEGYSRLLLGDVPLVDYVRPHIVLNFKNDIEKYKDDIIKYIDNIIESKANDESDD